MIIVDATQAHVESSNEAGPSNYKLLVSTGGDRNRELFITPLHVQTFQSLHTTPVPCYTSPLPILSLRAAAQFPSPGHRSVHAGPWISLQTSLGVRLFSLARTRSTTASSFASASVQWSVRPIHVLETPSELHSDPVDVAKANLITPLVDWAWHPERRDRALGVDSSGTVGKWDSQLFDVPRKWSDDAMTYDTVPASTSGEPSTGWRRCLWDQEAECAIIVTEYSIHRVEWLSYNLEHIFSIPKRLHRPEVFTSLQQVPESEYLWTCTTLSVQLFDLRKTGAPIVTWAHHRGEDTSLTLSLVPPVTPRTYSVVLSSRRNRLLQVYSARDANDGGVLTSCGMPTLLPSALSTASPSPAAAPLIVTTASSSDLQLLEMQHSGAVSLTELRLSHLRSEEAELQPAPLQIDGVVPAYRNAAENERYDLSAAYTELLRHTRQRSRVDGAFARAYAQANAAATLLQRLDFPPETLLTTMDLLALGRPDADDELISAALCTETPSADMLGVADAVLGERLSDVARSLSIDAWAAREHCADINDRFYHGDLRATPAELVSNATSLRQLAVAQIQARYSTTAAPQAEDSEMARLASAMESSYLTAETARDSILCPCIEEVALDAVLSSQVGGMRAIRVTLPSASEREESAQADQEQESFAMYNASRRHLQSSEYDPTAPPPPLHYSTFVPRPSADRRARGGGASTTAARLLLAEWEVGTHPSAYVARNPYVDIDPDVGSSGTESASSRASSTRTRHTGSRQRSGTAASQRTARTPSVPPPVFAPMPARAPPAVAPAFSSTQPVHSDFASQAVGSSMAALAESSSRRYHSQLVPGAYAGGIKRKPKKNRRVGGF